MRGSRVGFLFLGFLASRALNLGGRNPGGGGISLVGILVGGIGTIAGVVVGDNSVKTNSVVTFCACLCCNFCCCLIDCLTFGCCLGNSSVFKAGCCFIFVDGSSATASEIRSDGCCFVFGCDTNPTVGAIKANSAFAVVNGVIVTFVFGVGGVFMVGFGASFSSVVCVVI